MQKDERRYIRVHDGMPDHPKVEALSDKAFRLLVERWCWCSRHTTDGRIPIAVWRKSGTPKSRRELVEARLVVEHEDHVVMHDYLKHQRSAEEIAEKVEQKRESGRLGNHTRWHAARGIVDPDCRYCAGDLDDQSHLRSQTRQTEGDERSSRNGNADSVRVANEHEETRRTGDRENTPEQQEHPREPSRTGSQVRSEHDRETSPSTTAEKRSTKDLGGNAAVGQRERERSDDRDVLGGPGHTPAAHRLVEDYAASCRRRPPRGVLTDLAREVDALLHESWPPDEIARALTELGARGKHAKLLPAIAHELVNRVTRPGPGQPRPSTTDMRTAAVQALKQDFQQPARQAAARLQLTAGATP